MAHGPRGKQDHSRNQGGAHVKMRVADRPGFELGEHRRKASAPREANAFPEMAVKRPGERNRRERDEIRAIGSQASQPSDYRGPETRDQRVGVSG